MKYDVFKDCVREFYYNMYNVFQDSFKTYFRAKTITVSPYSIGELLEVQRPPNSNYPFPDPANVEMHKNDVVTALCGRPTEWNLELLYVF